METKQAEVECREFAEGEPIPATQIFAPKWYLNGFPKSGTHLLVSMMAPYASPMPPTQMHPREWIGTFRLHSWSEEWADMRRLFYDFGHCLPGHFFKGHCGHTPELERYLWNFGMAHVFVYRDLRDVAVSQTYHVLSDKAAWKHPDKDLYRDLGSFDAALEAVIVGIGRFPGVLVRWEHYAPWLDVDWVLSVKYADARLDPQDVALRIAEYGIWRLANIYGLDMIKPLDGLDELVREMVEASRDTDKSPTFRRGEVGSWREVFTERHRELFKETDKNDWLARLGFEDW